MSSSRSIAAARNRRAGDSGLQTKMPSKQPVTSINSQRAFLQNADNNVANTPSAPKNGMPFSKLTVSDAVGLITLRLGKVEQYLIDLQNSDNNVGSNNNSNTGIDNSVLTTIINRLDALEKKEINNSVQESIKNLTREIATIKQTVQLINKNAESLKLNVNNRFNDIELAFVELEKNMDNVAINPDNITDMDNVVVENAEEEQQSEATSEEETNNVENKENIEITISE
jgi:hypothetical protein